MAGCDMLRTIWLKTLRDHRLAIVSWGLALGLTVYGVYATANQVLKAGVAQVYQSLQFLAEPVAIDTPAGYVTFRLLSWFVPTLLAIWALLTGARLVRGDEERGTLDVLLACPVGRARFLLAKLLGAAAALLLICAALAVFIVLGQLSLGESPAYLRAAFAALNIYLFELCVLVLAALLSHLLRVARTAAGWTAALLATMLVLDGLGRTVAQAHWVSALSIYHYYNANKPLVPTVSADWLAAGALAIFVVVCTFLGIEAFTRRDLGGVAVQIDLRLRARTRTTPVLVEEAWCSPWVRLPSLRTIRARLFAILGWTLGASCYAGVVTWLIPRMLDVLQRTVAERSTLSDFVRGHDVSTTQSVLALIVSLFMPVVASLYALTLASSWSRDLDNGLCESELATPHRRARLLFEHQCAVLLAALLFPVVLWVVIRLVAIGVGVQIDAGQIAAACAGIFPLEVIAAALVYLLASRFSAATVTSLVGGLVVVSYLAEFLQPLLKLPGWAISLSLFHQYNGMTTAGMRWGTFGLLLGAGLVLLGAALDAFERVDLAA